MVRINRIKIGKLLRREMVAKAVKTSRILLMLLTCLFVFLALYYGYESTSCASTTIATLEREVNEISRSGSSELSTSSPRPQDYSRIVNKNIFGDLGPKSTQNANPTPKPVASLDLGLIGTFVSLGEKPFAIIEDKKRSLQEEFEVNDIAFDSAKVISIQSDRVEIERNEQIEVLTIDETPSKATDSSQNEILVDGEELQKAVDNLPLLLTQARAVPYFQEGKSVGLRLFAIRQGSLYEKLGLLNGDIIKSVNGNSLSDLTQAAEIFQRLKEEKSISLVLNRNNQDKEVKYQIR